MTDSNHQTVNPEARLSRPPRVCISTADHSGDAIGARLAEALQRRGPIELFGAGGSAMREAGVDVIANSTKWSVLGIMGWIPALVPGVFANWRARWVIRKRRPDLLVCIDSGGFNVAIARTLRWLGGQKVLYYVPPRSWSRKWSVRRLREADYVAAPFPWNAEGDDGTGRVRFVGHPAADLPSAMPPRRDMREQLGLDPEAPTVAMLPGSRKAEIGTHMPILMETVRILRDEIPGVQVVLSQAHNVRRAKLERYITRAGIEALTVARGAAPALRASDAALVCMGTATVEACTLGVPTTTFYRGTRSQLFEYLLRPTIAEFYALPNIIAGERVVDELIGDDVTPRDLADRTLSFLRKPDLAASVTARLQTVAEALGGAGAAERAADAVEDALNDNWHAGNGVSEERQAAAL